MLHERPVTSHRIHRAAALLALLAGCAAPQAGVPATSTRAAPDASRTRPAPRLVRVDAAADATHGAMDAARDAPVVTDTAPADARVDAADTPVARGRAWFDRFCRNCHPDEGSDERGPRLRELRWDEARMRRQIRVGSGAMRPVLPHRLPDPALADLIAYLRTLRAVR